MNPLSRVTDTAVSTITHPRRTAENVMSEALGLAALGVRTAAGVAGWAARRAGIAGDEHDPAPWEAPMARQDVTPTTEATPTPNATDTEPAPAPFSEASTDATTEAAEVEEVITPSGIPAADAGYNPDTAESDLFQPDTEPLMDPATVKAAKSEAETMQRAADPDKD